LLKGYIYIGREGYEKNIGTAGLLKGVIDNKLVFGGGAGLLLKVEPK